MGPARGHIPTTVEKPRLEGIRGNKEAGRVDQVIGVGRMQEGRRMMTFFDGNCAMAAFVILAFVPYTDGFSTSLSSLPIFSVGLLSPLRRPVTGIAMVDDRGGGSSGQGSA